jgi:hypothetical protein
MALLQACMFVLPADWFPTLSVAPKEGVLAEGIEARLGRDDRIAFFLTLAVAQDHLRTQGGYTVPVAEIVTY